MGLQLVLQSELLVALTTLEPMTLRWLTVVLTLSEMFVCLDLNNIGRPLITDFTEVELFL